MIIDEAFDAEKLIEFLQALINSSCHTQLYELQINKPETQNYKSFMTT